MSTINLSMIEYFHTVFLYNKKQICCEANAESHRVQKF